MYENNCGACRNGLLVRSEWVSLTQYDFGIWGLLCECQQVIHTAEEKLAGNLMKVFRCQSEVEGVMRVLELKYELQTCKWLLWKI